MKYNMAKEIWKPIVGYENEYEVSNLGNVKHLANLKQEYSKYYIPTKKDKILKATDSHGYKTVILIKNNTSKRVYVHRLVAQAFIPNPNNLPQVNHKDEKKTNNKVDNLEWCSSKYNANYGTRNEKMKKIKLEKYAKKVIKYDLNGKFIAEYESIEDTARKNNVTGQAITRCCKGKLKKCKNYIFKFKSEVVNNDL